MNDEQLRSRIAATDPMLDDDSIEPVRSASAQAFLENIMSTELDTPTTAPTSGPEPHSRKVHSLTERRNRWSMAALAVAAAAAIAVGGAALGGAFDRGNDPTIAVDEPTGSVDDAPDDAVLELSGGGADPAMMSCIQLDPSIIAQSPTAFRGIVDSIDGEIVTLTVDTWYAGGDAPLVTITAPLGLEALIGSIDFVPGEPYLISAYDGVVSYCGMSGAATPELQAMYDAAFPG